MVVMRMVKCWRCDTEFGQGEDDPDMRCPNCRTADAKKKDMLEGLIFEMFTHDNWKDMVEYSQDMYGISHEEMKLFCEKYEKMAREAVKDIQRVMEISAAAMMTVG